MISADDFLPLLIHVVVQARVPHLTSHLSYIQFRQDKTSESQYYLTTIRASLEYLCNDLYHSIFLGPRKTTSNVPIRVPQTSKRDTSNHKSSSAPNSPDSEEDSAEILKSNAEKSKDKEKPTVASSFRERSSFQNRSSLSQEHIAHSEVMFPSSEDFAFSNRALVELCKEMCEGEDRLELKDRKGFFTTFKNCFVAKEAVEWLERNRRLTTEHALDICGMLLESALIAHVSGKEKNFSFDSEYWIFKIPKQRGKK